MFSKTNAMNAMNAACLVVLLFFIPSCKMSSNDSQLKDIFNEDVGTERRRDANETEILWTVAMQGCTGALLSPEYFLTANHCPMRVGSSFTSGSAIVAGTRRDIIVEQIVETNQALDYAIAKIRWVNGFPKNQKLPPKIAIDFNQIIASPLPDQGDPLFTVGFPQDKGMQPTYSEGRAKQLSRNMLAYNIGTINGNSGGSVWRKSDGMLVSMTNAGPNQFGRGQWQGNDKNDSSHWNFGVAMPVVYQRSEIVKGIFPNGINKYVNTDEEGQETGIFVALGAEESDGRTQIWASVSNSASKVVICYEVSSQECNFTKNNGALSFVKAPDGQNRKLYSLPRGLRLQNEMPLTFIAFNNNDEKLEDVTVKVQDQ